VSELRLLALNLGSTTLKAATYRLDRLEPGHAAVLSEQARIESAVHADAHEQLDALLQSLPEDGRVPDVVVHRIVHGGDLRHGRELDEALFAQLDAHAMLAPLHQPAALALAREARLHWPAARHGAAFDTSFHTTLAPWSRRLPLPADWDAAGIRRYGFHGLAFASALRLVRASDPAVMDARVVFAHLGGGCSVCAVANGRSIDTTMSLTPLGGVPMPTRAGDLDPGILLHLLQTGMEPALLEWRLGHESGLAGIAGHGDVRRLLEDDAPASRLAIDQFVMRIAQAIASMATSVGGIDHLVFSGGSGHRAPVLRARIAERLAFLGVRLDAGRNASGEMRIDASGTPVVWSVAINEERELAESALAWFERPSPPDIGVGP
jgi:acetate kinase